MESIEKYESLLEYLEEVKSKYLETYSDKRFGLCRVNYDLYSSNRNKYSDSYRYLQNEIRKLYDRNEYVYTVSFLGLSKRIFNDKSSRGYYIWNPDDKDSRVKFLDELIYQIRSTINTANALDTSNTD